MQEYGTGIAATFDFGAGENISYGFTTSYLLNTETAAGTPIFDEKFDVKAHFNANI
jgi:hypothetical protein